MIKLKRDCIHMTKGRIIVGDEEEVFDDCKIHGLECWKCDDYKKRG